MKKKNKELAKALLVERLLVEHLTIENDMMKSALNGQQETIKALRLKIEDLNKTKNIKVPAYINAEDCKGVLDVPDKENDLIEKAVTRNDNELKDVTDYVIDKRNGLAMWPGLGPRFSPSPADSASPDLQAEAPKDNLRSPQDPGCV